MTKDLMTFTDFLKEKFVKEGEVIKENFPEAYYDWFVELEDKQLDEYVEQWRIAENTKQLKGKTKAETLKQKAQEIERATGVRVFGDCPICGDYITKEGKCIYCEYDISWTAEEICEAYNNHWAKGNVKPGYEREPKTPEDFKKQLKEI